MEKKGRKERTKRRESKKERKKERESKKDRRDIDVIDKWIDEINLVRRALSSSTDTQQWAACPSPGRPPSSAPERTLHRSSRPGTAGQPQSSPASRPRLRLCIRGKMKLGAESAPLHPPDAAPAQSVDDSCFVVVRMEAEEAARADSLLHNCHCPGDCCNTPLGH